MTLFFCRIRSSHLGSEEQHLVKNRKRQLLLASVVEEEQKGQ